MDNNWRPTERFTLQEIIRKGSKNLDISYVNNVSVTYLMLSIKFEYFKYA